MIDEILVLVVMDTRLVSLQDKVSPASSSSSSLDSSGSCDVVRSVTNLETLVKNLSKNQRHSGRQMRHESHTVDAIQERVDQIYQHMMRDESRVSRVQQDGPRFDYLRSGTPDTSDILTIEHSSDHDLDTDLHNAELLSLFRRMTTPFKRVNKV